MSVADIAGILENSKELDRLKKDQEDFLAEINKMHNKLQASMLFEQSRSLRSQVIDTSLSRLKVLYTQANDLSESEVSISTSLISQLDALLPTGPPAQPQHKIDSNEQKRKLVKNDPDAMLSPSMRNPLEMYVSLRGQQVAARVNAEDADKDERFIVKVTNFDRETKEFEVLDEEPGDEEEGTGQKKYKVPVSHIIPFPYQSDPSSAQDFQPKSHVLAVYPGTTALYRATVVSSHRKRKTDNYLLEFDDDEEDGAMSKRTVPFYNVVPLPEGHCQLLTPGSRNRKSFCIMEMCAADCEQVKCQISGRDLSLSRLQRLRGKTRYVDAM